MLLHLLRSFCFPFLFFVIDGLTFNLKLEQFPLNIANARTVHKLQGRTLENLVISNWSMQQGWACVALSRVRTLKGVFLRKPLDRVRDAGMNGDLRKMLRKFRQEVDVTPDGTCDTTQCQLRHF